jgi:hypothetical protein
MASASGGVTVGGTATFSAAFLAVPSGGLTVDGSITPLQALIAPISGGVTVGDGALIQQSWNFTSQGGLTLDGTAPHTIDLHPSVGADPLVTGGDVTKHETRATSGGVQVDGINTAAYGSTPDISGGVTVGGQADATIIFSQVIEPTGGFTLGGSATVQMAISADILGGLTIGGSASTAVGVTVDLQDSGVTVAGEAEYNQSITYRPVGGVTLAGSAIFSKSLVAVGNGGLGTGTGGGSGSGGSGDGAFGSANTAVVAQPDTLGVAHGTGFADTSVIDHAPKPYDPSRMLSCF